jgi:hypothetical protein
MPGDCARPLKKEKRMVISAPSALNESLTFNRSRRQNVGQLRTDGRAMEGL